MVVGLLFAQALPAEAQLFERRQRQAPGAEGFNPFGLFTPLFQRRSREPREYRQRQVPRESRSDAADHSRAPPPKKSDTTPTRHVAVMGASLSDWLAYGLEDIYADRPEVGIVRKNHPLAGLIRFDSKDEKTWPLVAREFLAEQNPDVIVVMLGLEDRQTIRERPSATVDSEPGEKRAGDSAQPSIPEPRPQQARSFEFRTEQWAEVYAKRVDELIAVLKSKGAPVIWVGLPAIRGTRSTSDMIYLNDLFRARAERAGIVYVDVWDGFVDEAGRYATFGPDVEGQVRRLRTAEGVYFTKAGARKLAHYVDRDIKRVMGTRLQPMAIPTLNESGQPTATGPAARPVAGPIMSLTNAAGANELLGGGMRPGVTDPLAVRALVKGSAIVPQSGRADDFFLTPEAAAEAAKEAADEAAKAEGTAGVAGVAVKNAPQDTTKAAAVAPVLGPAPDAAPPVGAVPPAPTIAEEPAAARAEPGVPAKQPVAGPDPAAVSAPRNAAAPGPAERPAQARRQQRSRAAAQQPQPRRDSRGFERGRQVPSLFDPLGLFR